MRGSPCIASTLSALSLLWSLACLTRPADAALIYDDFDYLNIPEGDTLVGHGEGEGWYSSWGNGGAVTILHSNLNYSEPGYTMSGVVGSGKACKQLGFDSIARDFEASAAGTVWFSVLVQNTRTGNVDMQLGAHKGAPLASILEFGLDGDPSGPVRPYVLFRGDGSGLVYGPSVNIQPVNLLIGRVDIDYDAAANERVRLWVDPSDLLSGEAGFGPPLLERGGYNAWSNWAGVFFQLAGGNCIDSLRIATNGTSVNRVLRPDCGNGFTQAGESCDDANDVAGDGCTVCQLDGGWLCTDEPSRCSLTALCGDGRPDAGEQCDDGNLVAGDGCEPTCTCTPGHVCTTCSAELFVCGVNLSDRTLELAQVQTQLTEVEADLAVATADTDQDEVWDVSDTCPDTPVGTPVDQAGCSKEQFCSAIDASTIVGRRGCKKADWRNDEAIMRAAEADCRVERQDSRCVAVSP